VVSASYGGGLIDYRVEMAGGQTLHVQAFPAVRLAVGDAVRLEIRPESYWLLGNTA
jgi:putative spermidine/putrescine transport system ATP-binding protein